MSQSINIAIVAGRLGQDPKARDVGNQRVCSFSVATSRSWKGKDDEWQEKTEWHNVVVWGRDAEKCEEHLRKGSSVTVHGRIESREYTKDDVTKKVTEIIAERVVFEVKKGDAGRGRDDDRDDRRSGKDDDRRSSSRRDDDRRSSGPSSKRDDDRRPSKGSSNGKPKPRVDDDGDETFDDDVPF